MYYHIYQIITKNLSNKGDKNIYFNFKKRLKNLHGFFIVLLYPLFYSLKYSSVEWCYHGNKEFFFCRKMKIKKDNKEAV